VHAAKESSQPLLSVLGPDTAEIKLGIIIANFWAEAKVVECSCKVLGIFVYFIVCEPLILTKCSVRVL